MLLYSAVRQALACVPYQRGGKFDLERCAPCSFCWNDHNVEPFCHLGEPGWCEGPKGKDEQERHG